MAEPPASHRDSNRLTLPGRGHPEGTLGRVQQFSTEGKPLVAWGGNGSEPGGLSALTTGFSKNTSVPIGALVDARNRVWANSLNDQVLAFTSDGRFLFGLGCTCILVE
jgi:hypothetical protein